MEPLIRLDGLAAPLNRINVDTDQIVPKQFLKRIGKTGFADALFFDWRFLPNGDPDPDFVLNRPEYRGAEVLITGRNFGCGSSREHAPWALRDFGFRALVAPSFADIFRQNCYRNGLLPIEVPEAIAQQMLMHAERSGYRVCVDLETLTISDTYGFAHTFTMDDFWRQCMMNGTDEIELTLQRQPEIVAYERTRPAWMPAVSRTT